MTRRLALALALAGFAAAPRLAAQEKLDWATLGRIRDEGFRRSQVMETAAQLTDVHGPRLTGSPQYKKAADWARQQLETWGLANAHLESWPFGRGWSFERCSAHVVVADDASRWSRCPKAWTAGTNGPVRGKVLRVKAESEADVETLKGKLAGMVLWVGQPRELKVARGRRRLQALHRQAARRARAVPDPRPARRARPGRAAVRPRGLPAAAPGAAGPREALRRREAARRRRALGARRQRPAAGRRRLAQEGRPAGGHAARGVRRPVEPRGAPPRPQDSRSRSRST